MAGDFWEGDRTGALDFGFYDEWADNLEKLMSMDFDWVIAGHGEPFRGKETIDYKQAFLRDLWSQVKAPAYKMVERRVRCAGPAYGRRRRRRTTRPFSPPVIPSCTAVPTAPSASHAIGTHCWSGAGFNGYATHTSPAAAAASARGLPMSAMAPTIIVQAPPNPVPTMMK